MGEIKSFIDLVKIFGAQAQEALDFISDETNHRKFAQYRRFCGDSDIDPKSASILVQHDRLDKETKIRIAMGDGVFLTKEEWKAGQYNKCDVIGLAVMTPCVQFILGLDQWEERWSENIDHVVIEKRTEAQALQVISGYEATRQIVEAQKDEGNTAAKLCWNYGRKGLQWYLPCFLELNAVCANMMEINELLELIGGTLLDSDTCYWSSTESSTNITWIVSFDRGDSYNGSKCYIYAVRPVVAI